MLKDSSESLFVILLAMVKHAKTIEKHGLFESVVLWVAITEPLSTLPQIIDLYRSKDGHSLSFLSWALFAGASIIWLIYGIRIKNLPLIASSVMWVVTELLLMVGILLYS